MIPGLQICIWNHERRMLHPPWALNSQILDLEWESMLPGGYGIAKMILSWFPGAENVLEEAHILTVNHGLENCYTGQISDPTLRGREVSLLFFGGWKTLKDHRFTDSFASTIYADDILEEMFNQECPEISANLAQIDSPAFDLGAISWTDIDCQQVALDLMKTGDSSDREWYLGIYEVDPKYLVSSEVTYQVEASTDDAMYDNVNGYDDGGNDVYEGDVDGRADFGDVYSGYRFDGVAIPQAAIVTFATFSIYLDGQVGGTVSRDFHCEDADDAATFAAGSRPDARTPTTAHTTKSSGWSADGAWNDVDITTAVQEVVNRAGWATGQAIVVLGKPGTGGTQGHYYKGVSFDDDDTKAAKLTVQYYTENIERLTYRPWFKPRLAATRENTDWLILPEDIVGEVQVTRSLAGVYNKVRAKYGGSSYTDAAEDTNSQELYGIRENDPENLDAGDGAPVATAEQVRDVFLANRSDPIWKTGAITLRRIRDRWGNPIPLPTVRPGGIARLQWLTAFDPDVSRCFWVVKTRYAAKDALLTIHTVEPPETASVLIAKTRKRAEG